jgi:two-component system, NtrC family, response regulator HydG
VWLGNWFGKPKTPVPPDSKCLRILALSVSLGDRFVLERIAKQRDWELRFTSSPREGLKLASQSHFDWILCDRDQYGYPWREVMDRLAACSPGSCIFLVSPVNGDYLWDDVLRRGGYDILTRPLREESALRAGEAVLRYISPEKRLCVGC